MTRRPTSLRRPRRGAGFTIIEIMAVLAVVGAMLLAVVPAIDGLVPKYRLRGAARELASMIEEAQSQAISERLEFQLAYDLDHHTYWLILPERPTDDGQGGEAPAPDPAATTDGAGPTAKGAGRPADDLEHGPPPPDPQQQQPAADEGKKSAQERETTTPKELPSGVELEAVIVGDDDEQTGTVRVPFEHLGSSGSHVVGLKLRGDGQGGGDTTAIWIKFNAMTRTIEYFDERPTARTIEGDVQ